MSDDYSPQLEDGYTRISNEFYGALTRARYPGRVKDFVHAIVRFTWGYGETWREVSNEDLCDYMGIEATQLRDLRATAFRHNLIDVELNETNNGPACYRVQKLYLEWLDYQPTPKSKKRGQALRHVPTTTISERSSARTGEGTAARTDGPPQCGADAHTYITKKDERKGKESARSFSDKERRLQKRQTLLDDRLELLTGLPQAVCELLEGWIENCAAANGTGTITLSREVSELRALLGLREEVGADAWAYGIFQANAKRATAINYIKKAAGSYRPGSSDGGLPADSPLLKMRGPARAEAFERTKPLEPPRN
ncbi:MAG: replication protein [Armatimonadota bacterium]